MYSTDSNANPANPSAVASPSTAGDDGWCGPLFIVGMPRSGTKLLRGLLSRHPRVRIPDAETEFFPFLARWVRDHGPPESERAFAALFESLRTATYFTYRRPEQAPFSWQEWRRECEGRYDAASLFEAFIRYELGAARRSGIIWGDKSPAYIRHIDLLLEHFPDARIVHLVRDVRDFCVSSRKVWNKDVRRAAYQWGRDVAAAHRVCQAQPRCLEIRYEDLLRSPETQLRRLSRLLRIDFSDAMTRLDRAVEHHGDAAGHAEIVQDNFSKFSSRLTPRELREIESLAWDTMKALGYEPLHATRQKHLGAAEQSLLRFKDGIRLVAGAARTRGLTGALLFHLSHARLSR
jgi:hypothetical protein